MPLFWKERRISAKNMWKIKRMFTWKWKKMLVLLHLMLLALGMLPAFYWCQFWWQPKHLRHARQGGLAIYKYTPLNVSEIHCVDFTATRFAAQIRWRGGLRVFACMCVCQGNQSTRYRTGRCYSWSCHDLYFLVMYLERWKSILDLWKYVSHVNTFNQLQFKMCLCSHRSHLCLSWDNSILFKGQVFRCSQVKLPFCKKGHFIFIFITWQV